MGSGRGGAVDDEILNQPPPLVNCNLCATDRVLREPVTREGAGWACADLKQYGRKAESAEAIE
jgi:putative acyl-CoA dehydrogenase